jgi:hypothetical protein
LPNSINLSLVYISNKFCQHAGIEKSFNPFKSIKLTAESPEATNEDVEPKIKVKGCSRRQRYAFALCIFLGVLCGFSDLSELLQHRFLSYPLR